METKIITDSQVPATRKVAATVTTAAARYDMQAARSGDSTSAAATVNAATESDGIYEQLGVMTLKDGAVGLAGFPASRATEFATYIAEFTAAVEALLSDTGTEGGE